MRGRDKFYKFKFFLDLGVEILSYTSINLRKKGWIAFRNVNGNLGLGIRYMFLKSIAKKCGDNVSIHPNVFILNLENLIIGDNVSIHSMSYIECAGELIIENDVSIAHACTIMTTDHNYSHPKLPIKDQGVKYEKIHIKENVWIGARSCILSGLTIDSGTIIAAGAVVTKSMPSNKIVAGVPAKVIKERIN